MVRVSTPSTRTRPRSGSRRRLIIRSVVVLPQPDGPIRTHVFPVGMSRLRSLTAFEPPAKFLLTFSRRITASVQESAPHSLCYHSQSSHTQRPLGPPRRSRGSEAYSSPALYYRI